VSGLNSLFRSAADDDDDDDDDDSRTQDTQDRS